MKMYQKIRNCKSKKLSIRQTAKRLELSRKTVSKYYKINDNKVYKSSIYDVLEEKYGKLPGTERTLRNYIQFLEEEGQLQENTPGRLYIPVSKLPFGKQMQVDFGEIKIDSGEKVYIFASVLSASRYRYVAIQKRPFKGSFL